MRKGVKILGIVALSVVTLCVAFFCVAYYMNYQYEHTPKVDEEWRFFRHEGGILCEWHYPAADGIPAYIEVCFKTSFGIQYYRIGNNRVFNYHHVSVIKESGPSEMQIQTFKTLSEAMRNAQRVSSRWEWDSPFVMRYVSDVPKVAYDSDDNENTILSCIISNMTAQISQYETDHVGYVSVMTWGRFHSWNANAYPMDQVPPELTALRNVFEQCMADPYTHEYHTSYIRGYPIPPPENPDHIPVLAAEWDVWKFACRQRDAVQFLPSLGRVLIPIQEGINPFRKFGVPYVPGNSLIVNYRNEDNDDILYLHGDNFWRVQVYGGEKPTE